MSQALEIVGGGKQTHFEIFGVIDLFAVDRHDAVGDTHDQFAFDHAAEVDVVADFLPKAALAL